MSRSLDNDPFFCHSHPIENGDADDAAILNQVRDQLLNRNIDTALGGLAKRRSPSPTDEQRDISQT
jgi:hypothetical protein